MSNVNMPTWFDDYCANFPVKKYMHILDWIFSTPKIGINDDTLPPDIRLLPKGMPGIYACASVMSTPMPDVAHKGIYISASLNYKRANVGYNMEMIDTLVYDKDTETLRITFNGLHEGIYSAPEINAAQFMLIDMAYRYVTSSIDTEHKRLFSLRFPNNAGPQITHVYGEIFPATFALCNSATLQKLKLPYSDSLVFEIPVKNNGHISELNPVVRTAHYRIQDGAALSAHALHRTYPEVHLCGEVRPVIEAPNLSVLW